MLLLLLLLRGAGNDDVENGVQRQLATFSHYSAAEWLLRRLDDYTALVVITVLWQTDYMRLNTQAVQKRIATCGQQPTKKMPFKVDLRVI